MEGRIIPEPFAYPQAPHARRHGPGGWNNYQKYRPWLRDEFTFRCVYCLERERWRDMREGLHIDHFYPQSLSPNRKCEYANLLYLCPACNHLKSATILPDPCAITLADCLRVHRNGNIESLNNDGELLIDVLALDTRQAKERRRILIGTLLSLAENDWPVFVEWMRFPDDLPDLAQTPPPHNDKPDGLLQSYFEKRRRSELAEVY